MSENNAQQILQKYREAKKDSQVQVAECLQRQTKQLKQYDEQLASLYQTREALESQITNLRLERAAAQNILDPGTLGKEKYLQRQAKYEELWNYFQQNTQLVYAQLREQTQKAQEIYAEFVERHIAARVANNQFIWEEFTLLEKRLAELVQEEIEIKKKPWEEAQGLLTEMRQESTLIQRDMIKYRNCMVYLANEDCGPIDPSGQLRSLLNYNGLSKTDLLETYQKLYQLYVDWFQPYTKINNWGCRTKDVNARGRTELYNELKPFLQLYIKFEKIYCDSTIIKGKTCSNCGGGLALVFDFSGVRYEQHNTLVQVHNNSCSRGDLDYTTWSCEAKKINRHFN